MYLKNKSKTSHQAFTLVELLVVLAIIGLLLSLLFPALQAVRDSGRRTACSAEIEQLCAALSTYEADYREYPPSTMAELGAKEDNKINSGIEALVACLSSSHKTTPYFQFREEKLENTDQDFSRIPLHKLTGSFFKTNALLELVDPWGNPYLYFHNRELQPKLQHFYILQGNKTAVTPDLTPTKTGNYRGEGHYQLISCGTDGVPHTKDDVISQ